MKGSNASQFVPFHSFAFIFDLSLCTPMIHFLSRALPNLSLSTSLANDFGFWLLAFGS
jgi:hypothetical protein